MTRALLLFTAATLLRSSFADCTPAPAGVSGWWPGDGSPASQLAGGPVTLQNGATYGPGFVGQAFTFDGQDDFVSTTLDVQPSAMPNSTWEAWVYPTRVNFGARQQIFSTDDGGYDRSVLIESGTSQFGVFTGNGVWQPAAATPNQWQHIAVVFTPANIFFYLNGVQTALGQAPSGGNTGYPLHIGHNPGYGEFFQGSIDEPTIYRRALSPAEIKAIYDAGAAGKCNSTFAIANDLAVTITPPAPPINIGATLTYSVVLQNNGPGQARGVILRGDLALQRASFVDAAFPAGVVQTTGSKLEAFLDSIASGASVTLTLHLHADKAGDIPVHFSVTTDDFDTVSVNNDATSTVHVGGGTVTPEDGDWTAEQLTLINTPEAALMVRVGDIDNLGFGWPQGFNPFSGASTPQHAFPWAIDPADPAGTDRIMVPSSYNGHPPGFTDGYTSSTSRPDNLPQPIRLQYSLGALNVTSAALQIFFDDFQAPFIGSKYQVTINGVRAPFMEEVINQLNQTGPIGKLVTFQIPSEYLDLVRAGVFELNIDDPTTGAADGHAIDFVKLLINPGSFAQVATVQGHITDTVGGTGVAGAEISINGAPAGTTAADGSYKITAVAGLSFVEAKKLGYVAATQSADLLANATVTLDFPLAREFRLAISTPNAQGLPLSWPGWAQNVQIEFTPTLSNPNWLILQAPSPTSVNGDNQVTLGLPLQEGFYRIKR